MYDRMTLARIGPPHETGPRRDCLGWAALVLLCLASAAAPAKSLASQPKGGHVNVLVILVDDLGETNNLAAQRPDPARDLRDELHRWRQAVGARMPAPNPAFDPARADLLPDPPMIPANPPRERLP